jgi:hypothetical protein
MTSVGLVNVHLLAQWRWEKSEGVSRFRRGKWAEIVGKAEASSSWLQEQKAAGLSPRLCRVLTPTGDQRASEIRKAIENKAK